MNNKYTIKEYTGGIKKCPKCGKSDMLTTGIDAGADSSKTEAWYHLCGHCGHKQYLSKDTSHKTNPEISKLFVKNNPMTEKRKYIRLGENDYPNFLFERAQILDDTLNERLVIKDPEIDALRNDIEKEVRRKNIKLISVNADPKTLKSFKSGKGYLTGILYLAPYNLSGNNVCPCATKDCIAACLHTAGNPVFMKTKHSGRIRKTDWFYGKPGTRTYDKSDEPTREGFLKRLQREITDLKEIAKKYDLKLAIRLNGTSDLEWAVHLKDFIRDNPDVQFYDYTKVLKRATTKDYPIHMTFSRSESNQKEAMQVLKNGGNVAMVFDKMPEYYRGYKVVAGDKTDLRFIDDEEKQYDAQGNPIGLIVGLKAKGKARNQAKQQKLDGLDPEAGFVIRVTDLERMRPEVLNPNYKESSSMTTNEQKLRKYIRNIILTEIRTLYGGFACPCHNEPDCKCSSYCDCTAEKCECEPMSELADLGQTEPADINLANKFAEMLGVKIKAYYEQKYPNFTPEMIARELPKVKLGAKYIKIDAQGGGKFMLGPGNRLYFIKGYGVVDLKKDFGNISDIIKADFDFDGYSIVKKGSGVRSKYGYAGQVAEKQLTEMRSIGAIKIKKLKKIIFDMWNKNHDVSEEEIVNALPPEWWDTWEMADQEIRRIIYDEIMKLTHSRF